MYSGGAPRPDRAAAARRLVARLVPVLVVACVTTTPRVTVLEALPPGPEPLLYVTTARQKAEVVAALRAAGLRLADRPGATPYVLRVTIGIDQGATACGTLNSVRYALRRDRRTVIEIDARGWTGTCEPNVLAALSQALRAQLRAATPEEEP